MTTMIEVTHYICPDAPKGDYDDNRTHHLVSKALATGTTTTCAYCGHTSAELRAIIAADPDARPVV